MLDYGWDYYQRYAVEPTPDAHKGERKIVEVTLFGETRKIIFQNNGFKVWNSYEPNSPVVCKPAFYHREKEFRTGLTLDGESTTPSLDLNLVGGKARIIRWSMEEDAYLFEHPTTDYRPQLQDRVRVKYLSRYSVPDHANYRGVTGHIEKIGDVPKLGNPWGYITVELDSVLKYKGVTTTVGYFFPWEIEKLIDPKDRINSLLAEAVFLRECAQCERNHLSTFGSEFRATEREQRAAKLEEEANKLQQ